MKCRECNSGEFVEIPKGETSDYPYFAERLEDHSLLEKALAIHYGNLFFLAVPVGGRRRGGWVPTPDRACARRVVAFLSDKGGFPNPRVKFEPGYAPKVQWGDRKPRQPGKLTEYAVVCWQIKLGKYYGYSDKAILDFILCVNLSAAHS